MVLEGVADGAETEEGVAFWGFFLALGVFVCAQIEGSDGEGFAFEVFDALFVGVELVFFGWGLLSCEVEELGAVESDTLSAFIEEVGDFVGKLDVSEEFDLDSIGGDRGELGEFVQRDPRFFGGLDQRLVLGDRVLVGIEDDGAFVPIDDDLLSIVCLGGDVFRAHDCWERECAGDDRGVGGASSEVGDESGDMLCD